MLRLGIVDAIVPEPVGAAHNDPASAAGLLDRAISGALAAVQALSPEERLNARYEKFRNMGRVGIDFIETPA
jgi:acetyl-CoA carboxylase carboxyl transferase subunit alpha